MVDLSWLDSFLATTMTRYPACVSLRAIANPRPRLPPVTRTSRMTRQFSRRIDSQGRNDVDRCRNLVPRKHAAAELQDLVLKVGGLLVSAVCSFPEYDIGNNQRPGDGVLPGPDTRHPDPRVAVDHGFN